MAATPEQIQSIIAPAFPGLMGVKIEAVTPDKVVASLLVRPELCNSAGGICHGGALMALADTLGGVGTMANLRPGERTTTIESKTNFMGAAPAGARIVAESVPLHRGRTTQVWQTTIRQEDGKLVAVVTQTQMVLAPR
jgi:uncharacterized protein (TIGR00369 family)